MSHDTQSINKQRLSLDDFNDIWVFGYGSLIYKVDFPILDKRDGWIEGWERRFWQGSHDHRGTPERPGRVLTLIESQNATCHGVAYQVTPNEFEHLDHREKNGYLRHAIDIHFTRGNSIRGIVYVADEHNEAYMGAAQEAEIAAIIRERHGPSGTNKDYVLQLADALRDRGIDDPHVFSIESYLREDLHNKADSQG